MMIHRPPEKRAVFFVIKHLAVSILTQRYKKSEKKAKQKEYTKKERPHLRQEATREGRGEKTEYKSAYQAE